MFSFVYLFKRVANLWGARVGNPNPIFFSSAISSSLQTNPQCIYHTAQIKN
jgi:hypothetical protein